MRRLRSLVRALIVVASAASCSRRASLEPPANKNEVAPAPNDVDLQVRARGLFDAVAAGDPSLAEPLWFPKEPFCVLKDDPDAAGYWKTLHEAFEDDVLLTRATRHSWAGTSFVRFEQAKPPVWVAPGEEHNFLGYYRAFDGRVHYAAPDGPGSFGISVMITWQGRWFATHLLPKGKKPG